MGTYTTPLFDQWRQNLTDGDTFQDGLLPGTGENDVPATIGITHSWTNVTALTTESDTANLTSSGGTPYVLPYLRASNFGFVVPAAATIVGVEATYLVGPFIGTEYEDLSVKLAWGVAAVNVSPTDKGTSTAITSNNVLVYGGSADLWGATLTPTIVNTSDFGVIFQLGRPTGSGSKQMKMSKVRVTVWYSITEDGNARVTQNEAMVIGKTEEDVLVTQVTAEVLVSLDEAAFKMYRVVIIT